MKAKTSKQLSPAASDSLRRLVRRPWKRYFMASQRRVKELIEKRDLARWSRDEYEKDAKTYKAKLEKIRRVASGEDQVANDDTGGMKWIADFIGKEI